MVEVNLEEDPEYPVAADYDEEELETLTAHDAHGTHVSLEDWEKSALQRQYTTPSGIQGAGGQNRGGRASDSRWPAQGHHVRCSHILFV